MTFRIIPFDTETIGLNPPPPPASGVVQLAWAELDPITAETLSLDSSLVNPQATISPGAQAVHGKSQQMVANAPLLSSFGISDPVYVVAHNAPFDMKFAGSIFENVLGVFCTLDAARHLVKGVPNHKLQTLADHLDLERGKAHDAEGDVITLCSLFRYLFKLSGCDTVEQFLKRGLATKVYHDMPFGMHKGKRLKDLPTPYILWMLEREIDTGLRTSLEMQMKMRG